jgi:hypothetical protein
MSFLSEAELVRLRPYLSSLQSEALPPAPLWRESDLASTLDHLTALLERRVPSGRRAASS